MIRPSKHAHEERKDAVSAGLKPPLHAWADPISAEG